MTHIDPYEQYMAYLEGQPFPLMRGVLRDVSLREDDRDRMYHGINCRLAPPQKTTEQMLMIINSRVRIEREWLRSMKHRK